jgi:hypothetical protein
MTRNEFKKFIKKKPFVFVSSKNSRVLKIVLMNIIKKISWALATRVITIHEHTIGTNWTIFTLWTTIIVFPIIVS